MLLQGRWGGGHDTLLPPSCLCMPAFPPLDPQSTPGSALSHPGGSSRPLDLGMPPNTTQIHWTP